MKGEFILLENLKTLAQNKKARHNYFIIETIECGIELFGTEVKSIRQGKVNIADSYASVDNGEVYVKGMNISLSPTPRYTTENIHTT